MAKKKKNKKQRRSFFPLGMAIYAVLFLGLAAFGLHMFWGYMEAFEASRDYHAIDGYMAQLTKEHVVDACGDILDLVDTNIQSEEECRQSLLDAISGDITYARKASESTENKQVFVLRCGKQVIGQFSVVTTQEDKYGFAPWTFGEESFDLSYLMGTETVSVTVPEGYSVYVNGVELDESYIVNEERREFALLEDFYGAYDLPELVLQTYEAGPFLNAALTMEAFDPQGNPFIMDESFDENCLIEMTDEAEIQRIDDFLEEFIDVYVVFAGCANDNRNANYNRVIKYVVPDSNLAQRMLDALDGMQFAQSMGDEVASIQVNHRVRLADGTYLYDVTYKVDTTGREGVVQTTTNVKMILVESDGNLLVESMIGY